MIVIPGYKVSAQISKSANSLVYRGYREQDNLPVIVKILKQDYPSPQELMRYEQEFEITQNYLNNVENTISSYSLEKYQNTRAIIFEDFGGKSLDLYLEEYRFTIAQNLELAIKITEGLEAIHAVKIIHKDINPSNIVYNAEKQQLKIIDFGISTILPKENPILKNLDELEGTLAYISPEQTGRMNRFLDRRSDFYSLGVTLYELLTKQLPFTSKAPLELIHSHIAIPPKPPHTIDPEIPQAVSDIVMKLLEKNAEDRYQSTWGLKADLKTCLAGINTNTSLDNFVLGKEDFSDRFEISPRLYGRKKEIEQLLTSFDRVKSGQKEISLIAGLGGVGKTTLVNEVRKLIVQQRSYFISGKFDQYKRDIPYSAFIEAFENLIDRLLSQTQAQLEICQQKLLAVLGDNAQLIIDIIPKIELIIGSQPALLELGVNEAENRFNLVVQRFIVVFASIECPLVIFLDDLQWADSGSLKLIKLLISNPEIEHLFLIGSYRDNEVDQNHPLTIACQEIEKTGININQIVLKPLRIKDIEELICNSFNCLRSDSETLAELLLSKTNGNPFFLNQLLQYLYQEELISFNYKLRSWQWDIDEIIAVEVTDNVVELTIQKISRLNKSTQNVLKLAACIGNNFSLQVLAIVNKKSISVTAQELFPAMEEGLILPTSNNYKFPLLWDSDRMLVEREETFLVSYNFLHDRVQEAAYALIPEAQKKLVHLQVGQLLLQNIKSEEIEENIFDIVNQLNIGKELITQRSQLNELAELNLIAGKKAKSSAAYQTALNHLEIGKELLAKDSWVSQYDLTLSLYLEAIEAAYLTGNNFDEIDSWGDLVIEKAKTLLDRVKVYQIKILADVTQNNNLDQATETLLSILKQLGVNLPKNPRKINIFLEFLRTRLALSIKLALTRKKIEDLIELDEMEDSDNSDKIAAIDILNLLSTATYFSNRYLWLLVAFKTVQLSIKYGNTASSASAYVRYANFLCGLVKEFDAGYKFGELALNLSINLDNRKYKNRIIKSRVMFNFNVFICHWREDVKISLPKLLDTYKICLETGELEFAYLSLVAYFAYSYLIGKDLKNLEQEIDIYSKKFEKLQQTTTIADLNYIKITYQVLLNLINKEKNLSSLIGEVYDEQKMLNLYQQGKDKIAIFYLYFYKLNLAYLFGEYEGASDYADRAEENLDAARGQFVVPNFYFYDSLTKLALFSQNPQKYKYLLKKVNSNQKQMKQWADSAKINYQHKYCLVQAELYRVRGNQEKAAEELYRFRGNQKKAAEELHRVKGNQEKSTYELHRVRRNKEKAADLYERAIELAKKHEYIHEEALAYELAANFYLEWDKLTIAKTYMIEARYKYQLWGANAKVKHLEENYPDLLSQDKSQKSDSDDIRSIPKKGSSRIKLDNLDLNTILETNKALSRESDLAKLLKELILNVIKTGGAQKVCLILPKEDKNNKLFIEALGTGTSKSFEVSVLKSIPIDAIDKEKQTTFIPVTIVNYVARKQESEVLENAVLEERYAKDLYVKATQLKSVLCISLINQGNFIGLVYLENNSNTGVFTPERVELLKAIANQAAILIQNAEAKEELKCKKRESEATNLKLEQFLEAIPVGVFIIDKQRNHYYTNSKAKSILGPRLAEIKSTSELIRAYPMYNKTGELYSADRLPIVSALDGENIRALDVEIEIKEDKKIPLEINASPVFNKEGQPIYAIAAFQDISERERLKRENQLLQPVGDSESYQVGSALPADASSYVLRASDGQLYQEILKGNCCYVFNARQMGKSSLCNKTISQLEERGDYHCAAIDLAGIGSTNLSPEVWYSSLTLKLYKGLPISSFNSRQQLENWWNSLTLLSPLAKFEQFITEIVLKDIEIQVVIFIDEIDSIRRLSFDTDDFFALIRLFYNSRSRNKALNRVNFVLLGGATPHSLISEPKSTPFNFGIPINLYGFKLNEIQHLSEGIKDRCDNTSLVLEEILVWTGGQPFLTQKICRFVKEEIDFIDKSYESQHIEELVRDRVI